MSEPSDETLRLRQMGSRRDQAFPDEATVVAWRDPARYDIRSRRLGLLGLGITALAGSALFLDLTPGLLDSYWLGGLIVVAAAFGLATLNVSYLHLSMDATGLTISHLPVLRLVDPALQLSLRELEIFTRTRVSRHGFVDLAQLGLDDHVVWFVDDAGARTELVLTDFSLADAQRLYDRIEPLWRARRQSTSDDDGAEDARQQLAHLKQRSDHDGRAASFDPSNDLSTP